jgi:predicted nucleic acid-binding protein
MLVSGSSPYYRSDVWQEVTDMAELLYLDYNCFQRGFDDPRQLRIRLEAEACEKMFEDAENGQIDLVWSFMHEDENRVCPFPDRMQEVARLASLCRVRIPPVEPIRAAATQIQAVAGLSAKDAIHLAAAEAANAAWFVTCDDEIVSKASRLQVALRIVNPVDYVRGRW